MSLSILSKYTLCTLLGDSYVTRYFIHCRYIPVGVLEVLPQKINERPPPFVGRDDLETLMASTNCNDWVKIRWDDVCKAPVGVNLQRKNLGKWLKIYALAKRSNIVCQSFEIFLSSKMFGSLAICQNIAFQTSFTFVAQNMFSTISKAFLNNCSIYACQAMFCDVVKRSNIAFEAKLKCLTNNVW